MVRDAEWFLCPHLSPSSHCVGGARCQGEREPKIGLKKEPRCEWGEWPPEGAPAPNNAHSEQVGKGTGFQESPLVPRKHPLVTLAGCTKKARAESQARAEGSVCLSPLPPHSSPDQCHKLR